MSKPTVAYSSFCCPKDMDRAEATYADHAESNKYPFDEYFFVYQRCRAASGRAMRLPRTLNFRALEITEDMYPGILSSFGIKWPDPVLDELTHGWTAPHFWAHHNVNHLHVLQKAKSDYIVFADADCYMKEQPENGPSWVEEGISILRSNPKAFVVSAGDGGPERLEHIMSQQMFLAETKRLREMEMIEWDGTFIPGGPFQEYYGLLEGRIGRFMKKNGLHRYVLGPDYRYWHLEWH